MKRPTPTDKETTFEDFGLENKSVISRTDLNGNITFVNRAFCLLSGYDKNDLIGSPHSVIRHPDMPKAAFKEMWGKLQNNQKWHGFVKNLRKDGGYYWVESFIEPLFDENNNKIGYMSARKPVIQSDKDESTRRYSIMKEGE